MYYSYMLYQVEHPKTRREQREEDVRAGQLAAEFARLWRGLRRGVTHGDEAARPPRASGTIDACRIPRPRTS